MSALEVMPVLAYLGCIFAVLAVARGGEMAPRALWVAAAGLGALFFAFSLVTVTREGLLQFWVNHTTDMTGNQVWFDLLIAVTLSFYLLAPRARAVGMKLMPWAIAVILTACIALLPMLARVIWLEQRAAK